MPEPSSDSEVKGTGTRQATKDRRDDSAAHGMSENDDREGFGSTEREEG